MTSCGRPSPTRLAAGSSICWSATSASWLAGHVPFSRQAVAKHLAVLEQDGLVSRRKQGREVPYQAEAGRLDQATRPWPTSPPNGTGAWPRSKGSPKPRTHKQRRAKARTLLSKEGRREERVSKPRRVHSRRQQGTGPARSRRPGRLPGRTGQAAGTGEGAHPRRRRDRRGPAAPAHGRGRRQPHADRAPRSAQPAGGVRRAQAAHRLLLHVAPRPPRRRAVRRLHLGHHPDHGAVLPAFPRRHLRRLLPGPLRRKRPLPRLHGLAPAVVLRPGLTRRAPHRAAGRHDAPRVLPAARRPRLRDRPAEKALTRRSDELARRRQELPWVRVGKDYRFTTEDGDASLRDLFGGRSQMLVYHFMFDPDWNEGCPSCSAVTDGFAGSVPHFEHHDVAFVVVSRAPFDKLVAYKRRMGWDFRWVSSSGSSFNNDFHVTIDPAVAPVEYNYKDRAQREAENVAWRDWSGEHPGMSAFARDGDDVFHTYSAYSRGFDGLWPVWGWLGPNW